MSPMQESAHLCRDLHVLLGNGVPVPEALERIQSKATGRWRVGLRKAQEAAASGSTLSQALRAAGAFPRLLVEGMDSAVDHEPLLRISELLEEAEWKQRQTQLILSYPFLLLVAGLFLMWLVYGVAGGALIPLLEGMNLALPAVTRVSLAVTKVVSSPVFVLFEVLLVGWVYALLSGRAGTRLRLPLVGDWIRRSESVSWLNWLDYFMAQDMPLPEAMRRAAAACADPTFRAKVEAAAAAAERGQELSKALGREAALPPLALQMLSRGESLEFPPGYVAGVAALLKREQEVESEGGLACLEVAGLLSLFVIVPPMVIGFLLPLYQLLGNLG